MRKFIFLTFKFTKKKKKKKKILTANPTFKKRKETKQKISTKDLFPFQIQKEKTSFFLLLLFLSLTSLM